MSTHQTVTPTKLINTHKNLHSPHFPQTSMKIRALKSNPYHSTLPSDSSTQFTRTFSLFVRAQRSRRYGEHRPVRAMCCHCLGLLHTKKVFFLGGADDRFVWENLIFFIFQVMFVPFLRYFMKKRDSENAWIWYERLRTSGIPLAESSLITIMDMCALVSTEALRVFGSKNIRAIPRLVLCNAFSEPKDHTIVTQSSHLLWKRKKSFSRWGMGLCLWWGWGWGWGRACGMVVLVMRCEYVHVVGMEY